MTLKKKKKIFFFFLSRYLGHDTIHVSPAQVSRCIDASMHRYALSVNRPAIVWEIPHFGKFPAFLRERPAFLALFRNNKNGENRKNFHCMETFCSKELCENGSDSVT